MPPSTHFRPCPASAEQNKTNLNRALEDIDMKTKSKKTSFLTAVALGVAVLAGSALPSQAQTTTPQPQATIQIAQTSGVTPGGWYWPMMWWPVTSTSSTPTTTAQGTVSQPTASFWGGGWGGWWW